MMGYKCLYQKRRIQKYYCFFLQVTEPENSYRMETKRLKRCLQNLKDRNIRITDLTTDRYVQVKSYMAKEEASVRHWLDVWRVAKGKLSTEM